MKKIRGFTMLELILVIVLTSIVVVVTAKIIASSLSAYLTGQNTVDANWQGQVAVERMVRDIRATRSANDITTATASEYKFTDTTGTSIDYLLSGSTLTRNGTVLADGINSLSFTYHDASGGAGPATANIRYVTITMGVTRNNVNYQLVTSIFLRDLSS